MLWTVRALEHVNLEPGFANYNHFNTVKSPKKQSLSIEGQENPTLKVLQKLGQKVELRNELFEIGGRLRTTESPCCFKAVKRAIWHVETVI